MVCSLFNGDVQILAEEDVDGNRVHAPRIIILSSLFLRGLVKGYASLKQERRFFTMESPKFGWVRVLIM